MLETAISYTCMLLRAATNSVSGLHMRPHDMLLRSAHAVVACIRARPSTASIVRQGIAYTSLFVGKKERVRRAVDHLSESPESPGI
jgi:hypothetical protein